MAAGIEPWQRWLLAVPRVGAEASTRVTNSALSLVRRAGVWARGRVRGLTPPTLQTTPHPHFGMHNVSRGLRNLVCGNGAEGLGDG